MTRRSVMLPADASDLPTLSALWNEAGVREWRSEGAALTPARAGCLLAAGLAQDAQGLGWWLAYPWNNDPAFGCVGLLRRAAGAGAFSGPAGAVELIAAFGAEAWAQGHAGEAVAELVRYGVHTLWVPRLYVLGGVPGPLVDGLLQTLGFQTRFEADTGARRLRLYELDGAAARAPRPVATMQDAARRAMAQSPA